MIKVGDIVKIKKSNKNRLWYNDKTYTVVKIIQNKATLNENLHNYVKGGYCNEININHIYLLSEERLKKIKQIEKIEIYDNDGL